MKSKEGMLKRRKELLAKRDAGTLTGAEKDELVSMPLIRG